MGAVSNNWKIGDVVGPVIRALQPAKTGADLSWYVLQVFAGSELGVRDRIGRLAGRLGNSVEVYCPMKEVILPAKVRRGKKLPRQVVQRPAFAGYLFVALSSFISLPPILDLPSVVDFVRQHGCPTRLRSDIVDKIRMAEDLGSLNEDMPTIRLQVGDHVLISDGVFRGFPATITGMPSGKIRADEAALHTATVAIDVLGGKTRCQIALDQIEET